MMATAISCKKTIGIWRIVCILANSACFLIPLIQSQDASAEKTKIIGTLKGFARLASAKLPGANPKDRGSANLKLRGGVT